MYYVTRQAAREAKKARKIPGSIVRGNTPWSGRDCWIITGEQTPAWRPDPSEVAMGA